MTHTDPELCQLALMPSGRRGAVRSGTNLLEAARQLGVELESICGGRQTCGKCQVMVDEGHFPKLGLTSAADHLSPLDARENAYRGLAPGRRLACACEVTGDVLIVVPEESQARKQIIAKAATDRPVEVDPAVRQVYVEFEAAQLEAPGGQGDWERLQAGLQAQWNLSELTIDLPALLGLQTALENKAAKIAPGRLGATVSLWREREVLRVQPGYAEGACGLAVDIGSTTVVAHLCDLRTGAVLASQAAMNPQVRFGEDLMSRVSYAMTEPQGAARMHHAIIATLNDLARKAAAAAGRELDDVLDAVLVGNSVMHHLLLGLDPTPLGGAPFALVSAGALDLKARDLGLKLNPSARAHILPCIAGHVGADHMAVQLAEAPHQQAEMLLVVDVGTNAEISLGNRQRVVCASSPTGPAFEGAQITHGQRAAPGAVERVRIDPLTLEPRLRLIGSEAWIAPGDDLPEGARATGICGSGIIEVVAEMFLAGLLTADGRIPLAAAERTPRVRLTGRTAEYVLVDAAQSATGRELVVTQNDVRNIQLAKAALYAGARLLMHTLGVTQLDRIVLAGAFGTYIDPRHAMILGLIPDCDLARVTAVGNAAGDGARLALLNCAQRAEAVRLAGWIEHVQIATDPNFQDVFVAALGLPNAVDDFPHLAGQLPERPAAAPRARRRRTAD